MDTIQRVNRLFSHYGVSSSRLLDGIGHHDIDALDSYAKLSTRAKGVEGYLGARIRRHEEHAFNREVTDYFFWLGNS